MVKRGEYEWYIHSLSSPYYASYRRLSPLVLVFLFLLETQRAMFTSYSFSFAAPVHSGHFLNLCSGRQPILRLHITGIWSGQSGSSPSLSQSILSCCLPVIHWAKNHIFPSFCYYFTPLPSCFLSMMRPMHGHTTLPSLKDMALIHPPSLLTFCIFLKLFSHLLLPFLQ